MSKLVRGNFAGDQVRAAHRAGDSPIFQMATSLAFTENAPLLYGPDGSAISGAVAQLVPTLPADASRWDRGVLGSNCERCRRHAPSEPVHGVGLIRDQPPSVPIQPLSR